MEFCSGRYRTRFWLCIGQMQVAWEECYREFPQLAEMIDEEKLKMIEDDEYLTNFEPIIKLATELANKEEDEVDFQTNIKQPNEMENKMTNENVIPVPEAVEAPVVEAPVEEKQNICGIREIKTYQADDGRKVQILSKVNSTKTNGPLAANFDTNKDDIFVGSCLFNHQAVGPQQIVFEIKDVTNYIEAFDKFDEYAEPAIKESAENINKQIQERMKENPPQPQILTPDKKVVTVGQ